jgi:hypothetical protein
VTVKVVEVDHMGEGLIERFGCLVPAHDHVTIAAVEALVDVVAVESTD